MAIRVVRCVASRFDEVVAYIARHNPAAEHHIGYFGLTPEDIRHTLRMLNQPFDRTFRVALDGAALVGLLGTEADLDIGRAWLFGPLVTAAAWDPTADALYAAVAERLPPGIREHELFADARNERVRQFAARHDFETYGEWAIYYLTADRLAQLPAATAGEWDDRYAAELASLHNSLFPGSNYTLAYIMEHKAQGAVLLVAAEGGDLNGYFFGRVEVEAGEAYVDLVGVAESHRRAGLGRRLMLAGLDRIRATPGVRQVNLTVAAGNSAATTLYDALGFVRERDMIAFRKKVQQETG